MRVLLSNMCLNLAGLLDPALGYFLVKRGDNFYSIRSKWGAPPDGHWRFIVLCAELAQNQLYISDIEVGWLELMNALYEAKCFTASEQVRRNYVKHKASYNARDILNLKTTLGL